MALKQEPFTRYNDEKVADTFTVKLNEAERSQFEKAKRIIEQKKDSTALKQLAWIGTKVLLEEKTEFILATVFKNKRKNARIGIIEFDD